MRNNQQRDQYIEIDEENQQVRFRLDYEIEIPEDDPVRLASAQLEELEYSNLYRAYSRAPRKSQVEPRIMFKVLVYAYMCGTYSTRKIEEACRKRIDFMWLLRDQPIPDHCTISRFRSGAQTQAAIEDLFYQYVSLLDQSGETEHQEVFIDGTKLESKANKYTFVWRKRIEKQLVKIKESAKQLLQESDLDGNSTQNKLKELLEETNRTIAKESIIVRRGRGNHKPELVSKRDQIEALYTRWVNYKAQLDIIGESRNSYSKTDPDATFMHMKEDHMRNGQLKAGYNVQFAVNSEYITGLGVFSNRTDYGTFIPLLTKLYEKHNWQKYEDVVGDSGYESLANYRYLKEHGQSAYIKPNNYTSSKTKKYKAQIGRVENMTYCQPSDYFLCANGQHLDCYGTYNEIAKDGTQRQVSHYRCESCADCPHRSACCRAKDPNTPKEVEICWEMAELRQQSLENITTPKGKNLRVNRSIQVEGAFGQLKHNRQFRRFLTKGNSNVTTELFFLALSQNVKKYLSKCNREQLKTHLFETKAYLKF